MSDNRHADTLATHDILGEVIDVSIIKKTLKTTVADLIPAVITNEEDRYVTII